MSKNTKANLTLVFSINKKNATLEKALDSIKRQTDKNFNIIFALSGASYADKETLSKFDFSDADDVQHIVFSESLGDSYVFNYCLPKIKTKYFYMFDSNVILNPDFISTINKFIEKHTSADVISFYGVPNYYIKDEFVNVKTLSDDFCIRPLLFFDNKVLSKEYIEKNKLFKPLFKQYPVHFYISLFKDNPKWYSIGRQICFGSSKKTYQFNVMDLFEECEEITKLLKEKPFSEHKDEIEYMVLIGLTRNFVYTFFEINRGRFLTLKSMLNRVESFLGANFPKWRDNKWLHSKKNLNDKEYLNYVKDFKPRLLHVLKSLHSRSFKARANVDGK